MAEEDKVQEYVVREGRTFGVDRKQAGESVFLTEKEAENFLDLLELRVKPRKEAAPAPVEEDKPQKKK